MFVVTLMIQSINKDLQQQKKDKKYILYMKKRNMVLYTIIELENILHESK